MERKIRSLDKLLLSEKGIGIIYYEDKKLYQLLDNFFSTSEVPSKVKIDELNKVMQEDFPDISINSIVLIIKFNEIRSSFADFHEWLNNIENRPIPPSPSA